MHITRAFLDGMKEIKSINVNMINTIDKKINYCKGCFICKRNGGICVQKDDMDKTTGKRGTSNRAAYLKK